ncbi:polysaccharide deacetylase family protein [Micromonospora fluostatini]|uniref:Polysaccharide deacetylase family protein n=1 Tax=Micromonospora fluostatini TaxID=1629071 RepID=A0ABY2DDZ1_9ACTN|nr:polysaccharide deacetylase family protein [Micromonospora fluostatini]
MSGGAGRWSRRTVLRQAALLAGGATLATSATQGPSLLRRGEPLPDGPVSATLGGLRQEVGRGVLPITWAGGRGGNRVALTFDDGPRPQWTPMVLDTLDRYAVPATFFLVGERARRHADLVRGRLGRHEVGNHSWAHHDLARLDAPAVHEDLCRAHEAVAEAAGVPPRLFRPPYGHLGGAVLHAAVRLDYRLVLWSLQMVEREYPDDPVGHARRIVADVRPGTILLAHDVGTRRRRVALDGLPLLITGLRDRGYEFVTVSQMLQNDGPAVAAG